MKKQIFAIATLSPLLVSANTCFWSATMQGSGYHNEEEIEISNSFAGGTNAYESPICEEGQWGSSANSGTGVLKNMAEIRGQFSIDPVNRILRSYCGASTVNNSVMASSMSVNVGLRDYYRVTCDDEITVRISYTVTDWIQTVDSAEAQGGVYSMATDTRGSILPIEGDVMNIAEGCFMLPDYDQLPFENQLGYERTFSSSFLNESATNMEDFDYSFTVTNGAVVAIDTLVANSNGAGKWYNDDSGRAYGGTMSGPCAVGNGGFSVTPDFSNHRVEYSIEITSGNGSFEPYTQIVTAPEPAGKMEPGTNPSALNLVLAGESGITYQVETSTNLVDWTTWSYETGKGSAIEKPVDTSGTNACFYRITPIKK
jgi:hypothetical protein